MKGLRKENVQSFYDNLEKLYREHGYSLGHVWNCNKSGIQARKDRGGLVIARIGARHMHALVLDQWEWLPILVCVNVAGFADPFYIL